MSCVDVVQNVSANTKGGYFTNYRITISKALLSMSDLDSKDNAVSTSTVENESLSECLGNCKDTETGINNIISNIPTDALPDYLYNVQKIDTDTESGIAFGIDTNELAGSADASDSDTAMFIPYKSTKYLVVPLLDFFAEGNDNTPSSDDANMQAIVDAMLSDLKYRIYIDKNVVSAVSSVYLCAQKADGTTAIIDDPVFYVLPEMTCIEIPMTILINTKEPELYIK
jgi:hypothetical protein